MVERAIPELPGGVDMLDLYDAAPERLTNADWAFARGVVSSDLASWEEGRLSELGVRSSS